MRIREKDIVLLNVYIIQGGFVIVTYIEPQSLRNMYMGLLFSTCVVRMYNILFKTA